MTNTEKAKAKAYLNEFTDKVVKGMELAYEKLVRERAKEDGFLVFEEDGKIVHKKAKDLLKEIEERKLKHT